MLWRVKSNQACGVFIAHLFSVHRDTEDLVSSCHSRFKELSWYRWWVNKTERGSQKVHMNGACSHDYRNGTKH